MTDKCLDLADNGVVDRPYFVPNQSSHHPVDKLVLQMTHELRPMAFHRFRFLPDVGPL